MAPAIVQIMQETDVKSSIVRVIMMSGKLFGQVN